MSIWSPQRTMRLAPGAVFALLGILAIAPSSARAGCNNHVRIAGQSRFLGMDSFADMVVGTLNEGRRPSGPGDVPPCSGPSCSEGSRVPFSPLSVSAVRHHELWCNTAAQPPGNSPDLSATQVEHTSLYRLGRQTDVDRPPRPLAA